MEPSAAGAIVPVGRLRAAGGVVVGLAAGGATAIPVGALELLGAKQTSNSNTGVSTSRPCVSVTVKEPTTLDGPPAGEQALGWGVTSDLPGRGPGAGVGGCQVIRQIQA